jgi:two-component system, NarL family, nitrate/nitrite response regulator NarL
MSAEHLFLTVSNPEWFVPARWREAFPAGHALNLPALLARLQGRPGAQSVVWLHTADALWATHVRDILQNLPGARVVVLSATPQAEEGLSALNDGVRGYTHAYAVPELLQEVALVVEHGGLWVGPDLLQRLVASTHAALARRPAPQLAPGVSPVASAWPLLSGREAEVARAVSAGRSNKEVAEMLHISERTVKAHLGAVFDKLGVRDRLQLVLRLSASADLVALPEPEIQP